MTRIVLPLAVVFALLAGVAQAKTPAQATQPAATLPWMPQLEFSDRPPRDTDFERPARYPFHIAAHDHNLRPRYVSVLRIAPSPHLRPDIVIRHMGGVEPRVAPHVSRRQRDFMRSYQWYMPGSVTNLTAEGLNEYIRVELFALTREDAESLTTAVVAALVEAEREREVTEGTQWLAKWNELKTGRARIIAIPAERAELAERIKAAEAATGFMRPEDVDPVFLQLSGIVNEMEVKLEGLRARRAAIADAKAELDSTNDGVRASLELLEIQAGIDAAEWTATRAAAKGKLESLVALRALWYAREAMKEELREAADVVSRLEPQFVGFSEQPMPDDFDPVPPERVIMLMDAAIPVVELPG